jgi:hypothetical protein
MSIGSFLKALVPFASSAVSDVDKEVAVIQSKATADIALAKLKAGQQADAAVRQAKHANWAKFQADYEAYLAAAPANPSTASAATGPTGPTHP